MSRLIFFRVEYLLVALAIVVLVNCSKIQEELTQTMDKYEVPELDKKKILSQAETLLDQNKGKAVVTGRLLKEGSLPGGLLKVANAGGDARYSGKDSLPLANADILFYDALAASSQSAFSTQTDSTGTYYAILDEGTYFAFAVKFDPISMELITARIDNIDALLDSVVEVQKTTAIEDLVAPTVTSIHDATAPTSGIFLVSGIPHKKASLSISFSEPMDRKSSRRIILGVMDTSSSSTTFNLIDTVLNTKVIKQWNGDNTVLTLSLGSNDSLQLGSQYGLIIPTSLKDLARNALEEKFKATFVTIERKNLKPFSIQETYPSHNGKIKPMQNPALIFNRPVDVFSILKGVKFNPEIKGIWEILGNKAVYKHKDPLKVNGKYTLSLSAGVQDLLKNKLDSSISFTFNVEGFTGAAASTGEKGRVARLVENVFDAFQQGDIPRFSTFFDPNFRLNEEEGLISKDQFIDNMRQSVAEKSALTSGILAPIFDVDSITCSSGVSRWKVLATDKTSPLWVETNVPPGASRGVYQNDGQRTKIEEAEIKWDNAKPAFEYKGKTYKYDGDYSQFNGSVTEEKANENERFWGELLGKTSTVALSTVKAKMIEEFEVDSGIVIEGDTARVAVRQKEVRTFSRLNHDPQRACDPSNSLTETNFGLLKFVLVQSKGNWLVVFIDAPRDVDKKDYEGNINYKEQFNNFDKFKSIAPFKLYHPVKEQEDVVDGAGNISFAFQKVKDTLVGGYLVGLAEDPKYISNRPPHGGLFFVKQAKGDTVKFKLDKQGQPVSGSFARAIVRNIFELKLPGWERTLYDRPINVMIDHGKGLAGIYYWKAIAIADTSAAQFLGRGFSPQRFYGESDFSDGPKYGHFSVKPFPDKRELAVIFGNQQQGPGGPVPSGGSFDDADGDRYPNEMEEKYGTNPRDRASFPDFMLDTDQDKMADFLEEILDSTGVKDLVHNYADEATLKAQIESLKKDYGIELKDSDGDGFPDDVEQMLGFDPNNAQNKPGTRARVEVPTGVFSGLLKFGNEKYDLSLKVIKDSVIRVGYTAYIGQDTLTDTVRARFDEGIAELSFPILLESGPDSGYSLLLRAFYESFNSIFKGPVDRVSSVPKTEINRNGGPFKGNWAATNKIGVDVSQFLGGGGPGNPGGPNNGPGPNGPNGPSGYREPPSGVDPKWEFIFGEENQKPTLLLIDDFGDTVATFKERKEPGVSSRLDFRSQPNGDFDVNGNFSQDSAKNHEEINIFGRLFRWKDGADPATAKESWVFDGTFNKITESCDSVDVGDPNKCLKRNFKDVPGQFSAKIEGEMQSSKEGLKGTLIGWAKQDEFGTGFNVGPPDNDGDCVPQDRDPDDNNFDVPQKGGQCNGNNPGGPGPGGFSAPPYLGTGDDFRKALLNKGINTGDTFNIKILEGNRIMQSVNDSLHVTKSHQNECGFVRVYPLVDEKREWSDTAKGWQIIILEKSPGIAAFEDKVKDSSGNILSEGAYVATLREVRGGQCDGNQGPPNPNPGPGPGGEDKDGDCVRLPEDTDDSNPDVPVQGGRCNQGPGPGGNPPPFFRGTVAVLKPLLEKSNYEVLVKKDPQDPGKVLNVGATAVLKEEPSGTVRLEDPKDPQKGYVFVGVDKDDKTPLQINNRLVVMENRPGGNGGEDKDNDCVPVPEDTDDSNPDIPIQGGRCNQGPGPGGSPPPLFKGAITELQSLLDGANREILVKKDPKDTGRVVKLPANVQLKSDPKDGTVKVEDPGNPQKGYVFIGLETDDKKPLVIDNRLVAMEPPGPGNP